MKKLLSSLLIIFIGFFAFFNPSIVKAEILEKTLTNNVSGSSLGGDLSAKFGLDDTIFEANSNVGKADLINFHKDAIKIYQNLVLTISIKEESRALYEIRGVKFNIPSGKNPQSLQVDIGTDTETLNNKVEYNSYKVDEFYLKHTGGAQSWINSITIFYGLKEDTSIDITGMGVEIKAVFDESNPDVIIPLTELTYNQDIVVDLGEQPGYEFAFWVVDGIVRKDLLTPSQTFKATNDLKAIAVYNPTDKNAVLFVDHSGKLIDTQYIANEASAVEPTVLPTKVGYKHADNKWLSIEGSAEINSITANTVFKLQYERNTTDPIEITLTNATEASLTAVYNDVVTVSTDLLGFTHWEENGKVVSYQSNYSFSALYNRELTAVTGGTPEAIITISRDIAIREGYYSKVAQVELPEGYELLEYGYLISNEPGKLNENNATRVKAGALNNNNEFLTSISKDYANIDAYAIIKNDLDEVKTIVTAYAGLMDLSQYNLVIDTAQALVEANYTVETWAALDLAITNNVVTIDSIQLEIDLAVSNIEIAITNLEYNPNQEPKTTIVQVDKTNITSYNSYTFTIDEIEFSSKDIMKGSGPSLQFRSSKGEIKNNTSLGKIISIKITTTGGSNNLSVYGGTNKSGVLIVGTQNSSVTTYDFTESSYNNFYIVNTGGACYISSIEISYILNT